jgi:hypothetical protein
VKAKVLGVVAGWLATAALACAQAEIDVSAGMLAEPATAGQLLALVGPPPPRPIDAPPIAWYASLDYVAWWVKPAGLAVPLVATTRGAASLDDPTATVLLGNQDLAYPTMHGFRATFGFAPVTTSSIGAEATCIYLPGRSTKRTFAGPGLFLPFLDTETTPPRESGLPVAGDVSAASWAEFWSAEFAPWLCCYEAPGVRVDGLVTFRHLGLRESLELRARSRTFETFDRFETRNYFFGAGAGARCSWESGRLVADVTARLALGAVAASDEAGGYTVRDGEAVGGGFFSFAQQGEFRHARFAVVPDVAVNVGWRVCPCAVVRAGYSFLYWSSVKEAGEQVRRRFDAAALPVFGGDPDDAPSPKRQLRESDFWAHGLSVGVEIEY